MTTVFRPNSITYLRIPTLDPAASSAFYSQVFDWEIREGDATGFTDACGEVIGHFVTDQAPTATDGVRPYIYVDDLEATLKAATAAGATIVTPPYPEGPLTVATLNDPAGNTIGIWTS
jgi:predicted enzyme related to lactoylglutathione lyase